VAEPTDRVQLIKQESTALGGDDADAVEWGSTPIEPEEDAIEAAGYYGQEPGSRDETVLIWREGGKWRGKDNTYGAVDLLASAGGGISEGQHELLDTLTHDLAETCYQEFTRSGGRVTEIIFWETSSKLKKVREILITRAAGRVSVITVKQYDGTGTLKNTLTGTITRTAGKVSSIDWVKS
jgi:hypothetical protein